MSYEATIIRDEDGKASAQAFGRTDVSSLVPTAQIASRGVATPANGICGALVTPRGSVIPVRCVRLVPPRRKSGCCDAHKVRLWDEAHPRIHRLPAQVPLAFDPPSMPVRGVADLPTDTHGRLKRSCALILGRLQAGPATGLELVHAGGGLRYNARIFELRKRGHVIEKTLVDEGRGIWSYRLVPIKAGIIEEHRPECTCPLTPVFSLCKTDAT
jgi:hypothetical protein